MKKQIIAATIGAFILLSAFTQIGIGNTADTPGTLQFIGDAGQATTFTVEQWSFGKVEMKDDSVQNIYAEIEMNTSSINAGWKDLVDNIKKKKDYFYVKNFPKATVIINGAKKMEDGSYETDAKLTLRGIEKPVKLTFTISAEKPYKVKGSGTITRQDFGFTGGGPKNSVPVSFEATLPLK
jgi:polyisoprenoid-binding protein YceI